jgi:hypothetical protein
MEGDMKNLIRFLVAAGCCAAALSTHANMKGDLLEIPKTVIVPIIDGKIDAVWKTLDNNFQNYYVNGATVPDGLFDLMGWSRLMYDYQFIYGFFYTQDDIIIDEHANTYERDSWEVYFDADNSKGTTAANGTDYDGVNDIQLRLGHGYGSDVTKIDLGFPVAWASGEFWGNTAWDRAAAGVEMAVRDTALGYIIEWKIPLESLYIDPTPETQIGIEFQQNDNDGDKRDHISHWWIETGDPSWNNAACWGTAVFVRGWILTDKASRHNIVCPDAVKGTEIPSGDSFLLAQNYPNPFNPSTRILYCLKRGGRVRLSLFDVAGSEVSVLMDGVEQAGDHQVQLELSGLASGVYFYRLETEAGILTRKMSLMR